MQLKLNQRKLFVTKRFEIKQRALKVEIKTPLTFTEEEYTYENLGTNFTRKKSFSLPVSVILICAILFLGIVILSYIDKPNQENAATLVVVGIGTAICAIAFLISTSDLINVSTYNGKVVSFFVKSPNREEVQEFIKALLDQQKKYMLKKYLSMDINLSNSQLINNLHWLWNRNIIDEDEFDRLNEKLQEKNPNPSAMGFKLDGDEN